jgi:hypothetical protein
MCISWVAANKRLTYSTKTNIWGCSYWGGPFFVCEILKRFDAGILRALASAQAITVCGFFAFFDPI